MYVFICLLVLLPLQASGAALTLWPSALVYLKITVARNDPAYLQIRSFDRAHVSQKARDHAHSRTSIRNRVHRIYLAPPHYAHAHVHTQVHSSCQQMGETPQVVREPRPCNHLPQVNLCL